MFGIHDFGVFVLGSLLLIVMPGQDAFYILGRSLSQGHAAGVVSVLGISTGSLVHMVLAALGLSALLTTTPSAFLVLKWVGAAYLMVLGVRLLLRAPEEATLPQAFAALDLPAIYRQGLLTNLLNPKVALFFLAFLPQFIATESRDTFLAFLSLGLCFIVAGTVWELGLAWFASRLAGRLRDSSSLALLLNRIAGPLFLLLGLRLVLPVG